MSIVAPSENAYFFEIVDNSGTVFEAFIDINDHDSELSTWDCRYRRKGQDVYQFLSTSLHPDGAGAFQSAIPKDSYESGDREKAVAEMFRMVDGYNAIFEKEFGTPSAGTGGEPLPSLELLKWFLKNKVSEKDNILDFSS